MPLQIVESGLVAGDRIQLIKTPADEGSDVAGRGYFGTDRWADLSVVFALFVAVVLLVARLRGVLALVGLAFSAAVVWLFGPTGIADGGVSCAGSCHRFGGNPVRRSLHDPRILHSDRAARWRAPWGGLAIAGGNRTLGGRLRSPRRQQRRGEQRVVYLHRQRGLPGPVRRGHDSRGPRCSRRCHHHPGVRRLGATGGLTRDSRGRSCSPAR